MRRIKIVGLAVSMALALIAFAGASSAAASKTTLCENNTNPCSSAYKPGTIFKDTLGSGGYVRLVVGVGGESSCQKLDMEGEYLSTSAEPVIAKILSLSLSDCSGGCSFEALSLPYKAELSTTEPVAGNGTMSIKKESALSSNPGFVTKSKCGFMNSGCILRAEQIDVTVNGGHPARLGIKNASFKSSGIDCRDMTMTIVQSQGTAICSDNYCFTPYPAGTKITAEGAATFTGVFESNISCSWNLSGSITQNPAISVEGAVKGQFSSVTWTGCLHSCEVSSSNLPWNFYLEANGSLWLENEAGKTPTVSPKGCAGFPYNLLNGCNIRAHETRPGGASQQALKLSVTEGTPASASTNAKMETAGCGAVSLSAAQTLTSPSPFLLRLPLALVQSTPSYLWME